MTVPKSLESLGLFLSFSAACPSSTFPKWYPKYGERQRAHVAGLAAIRLAHLWPHR